MIFKNKFNLLNLSKVFLVLLILSINVNGGNFFRTKEIFFILLIFTGFVFGDYKKIAQLLMMLIIYFSSLLFNLIFPGSNVDVFHGLFFSLGFLYLLLLVFDNQRYRNVTIDAYLISAKIVALFIIVVWIVCFIWNDVKWILITFFESIENDKVAFIFMIRDRKILDWWVPGVYYSTAPCLIPALAYYLSNSIRKNSNINKGTCVILFLGLVFTAARANMLAASILVFLYVMAINYLRGRIIVSIFFAFLSSIGSIIIMYLLLSDVTEGSLAVKALHKESYLNEFSSDYFRMIVFGWAAGSSFFTQGFNEFTMLTELTLYETVRRYGLTATILILFFIWLPPIFRSFYGRLKIDTVFLGVGLLIYILVASTNPFLLGSIGFCALFFFSSAINMLSHQNSKFPCNNKAN
ncbi:hypothetical protein AEA42_08420 [Shewanella sp. Sh95]|uniref:hypothetical protein n=1 Tax=Shewanella sp. Sh95 TaxID=1689868 RepID=UPI0006DAD1CE|nr:hypothetical protein [Shewanella sp. Sh95]KPN77496.1 hypothetical protein AEA42_08420 [Shewanella sp. Sh95]